MRLNVKPARRIVAWIVYLALVAVVYVVHACAVERDQQATPTTTASRSA